MTGYCSNALNSVQMTELNAIIDATVKKVQGRTAWRIDGTLREFPKSGTNAATPRCVAGTVAGNNKTGRVP